MNTCLIFAAKSFWLQPESYWAILKVVIGLGGVIFVHELGHFLLAKACGVKAEKFYVGFDAFDIKLGDRVIIPRRLVHWTWGETEYGIGILPFGGYVKMLGQDDNPGNLEEEVQRSMTDGESGQSALTPEGLVDKSKIDPRSYLAKSVPQRMAIISAGVIFNLLFAILFAALAFRSGVDYEPPMVGGVVAGGPAWEQDLVGASITKINDTPVEGYFTYMDLAHEIVFNGDEKPLRLSVERYGEAGTSTIEITPRKGFNREMKDLARLGITPRLSQTIGALGAIEGNPAALADPAFEPGDVILKINDTAISSDIDVRQTLMRDSDKVANFVLERTDEKSGETQQIETSIQRNPMRTFGFAVGWEPIKAIKNSSPASEAGLQVGDQIVAIDGQDRGDLMTLNTRMVTIARAGGTTELEVKRDGETQTITVTPVVPRVISAVGPNQPVAIDSLGVGIPDTRTIETVFPGSPAEISGVKVGDEIVGVKYLLSDEQKQNEMFTYLVKNPEIDLVADETTWSEIFDTVVQLMAPGSTLELQVKRGTEIIPLKLTSVASDEFFLETRGITLKSLQHHYQSKSWGNAFYYGLKQVRNDSTRVLKTFGKLIRGKISPKHLGGPGTIAVVATSEASRGTSRLLLFLTFLSANLAVVNLLPIPVLDGGHLLFLAYEGIFRRPVSERAQVALTYAGLAMILGLMVFVVCLDAGRIYSLF